MYKYVLQKRKTSLKIVLTNSCLQHLQRDQMLEYETMLPRMNFYCA